MSTVLGYSQKKLDAKAEKRNMSARAYQEYLIARRKERRKSAKKRAT